MCNVAGIVTTMHVHCDRMVCMEGGGEMLYVSLCEVRLYSYCVCVCMCVQEFLALVEENDALQRKMAVSASYHM